MFGTTWLPPAVKQPIARAVRRVKHFGFERYCPICESSVREFLPFGVHEKKRPDAKCPVCATVERHRFLWLFLKRYTSLFDGTPRRMLHIAPERELEARYRAVPGIDYLSADIANPYAMVEMDITKIQYPDDSFSLIHCSHVLEHVPDDRKAMRELSRVLRPDGFAIVLVPILREKTLEDPSITTPEERKRVFGQHDHVRIYGEDFEERLSESGFVVTRYYPEDIAGPDEIERFGLKKDPLFFCKKARAFS